MHQPLKVVNLLSSTIPAKSMFRKIQWAKRKQKTIMIRTQMKAYALKRRGVAALCRKYWIVYWRDRRIHSIVILLRSIDASVSFVTSQWCYTCFHLQVVSKIASHSNYMSAIWGILVLVVLFKSTNYHHDHSTGTVPVDISDTTSQHEDSYPGSLGWL